MALVELLLAPLPAHVRTARLVTVAASRRAGLDDELVDELRLAVGEAASRAVGLHARHAPDLPVRITIEDGPDGLVVTVTDRGPAAGPLTDDLADEIVGAHDGDDVVDPDVALALLTGLVDTATIQVDAQGTVVTLRWPLPADVQGVGATAVATT